MPTVLSKTWLDWFGARESADLINKQSQEKLFQTFNYAVDEDATIEALLLHDETVFIHKSCVGLKRVALFHHLVKVGGSIYDSSGVKFGAIYGLGESTSFPMIPDMSTLGKESTRNNIPVPTLGHLFGVSDLAGVDALTVSASTKHRVRNFVPVPPFLLEVIFETMNNHDGSAKHVLFESIKAIKEFDAKHADDTSFKEKAKSKSKDFIFWLYLVFSDCPEVLPVPVANCSDEVVVSSLQKIKDGCLNASSNVSEIISNQVERSLKRPFEVLASSSASTTDFMEKLTNLQSSASEKSAKSFSKLPSKYSQMILVASSIGEATLQNYDADGAEFFKSSNNLNAQILLNSRLEAESIDCSVSPAMTTSLLVGGFLWKNPFCPSGFASSVLSSEGIFRSDTLYDGMVLDLSTKHEITTDSLQKLTKSQVKFPSDAEDMLHRIRGLSLLAEYFFKKSSYLFTVSKILRRRKNAFKSKNLP